MRSSKRVTGGRVTGGRATARRDATLAATAACAVVLLAARPALAYVDPSVMTYTIQALAGVAVALSAVMGVAFRRSRKAILRFLHVNPDAHRVVEPAVHRIDVQNKRMADQAYLTQMGHLSGRDTVDKDRRYEEPWSHRLGLALAVAAFVAFTLLVVAPYEIVAANKDSLTFGLSSVWELLLAVAVGIALAVALVLSALRGRVFHEALAALAALGVASWLQALFMNGGLPLADGNSVNWTQYGIQALVTALVWVGLVVGLMKAAKHFPRQTRRALVAASGVLLVVQAVGVGSLFAEGDAIPEENPAIMTEQGLYDVSPTNNVVVFVLDTMETREIKDYYARNPTMFDAYDGFTWYQNSVGSMIPTRYGATYLLAGQFPQVGETFADYRAQTYDRSTFLDDLGSLGFSAAVYSDESVAWDEHSMAYLSTHTINVHPVGEDARAAVDPVGSLQVLYKAACYRDLPWPAKPFFWFSTEEINNGMTVRSAGADLASKPYVMDDAKYMAELQETGVSATDTGVSGSYRFIHLMGSHPPYTLYRDGTRVAAGTYPEDQSIGALNIVATYLQKLRDAGVYDQTTVIVTADHGEWYYTAEPLTRPVSPIMLVKPAGAHGTLQVSQAPVWAADVQATVLAAAGADEQMLAGYEGVPVWQIPEDAERTRTYYMTTSDWDRDVNVTEYHVEGPADDIASWHLTGRVWDVQGWSDASKNPPTPNVGLLPGE